MNNLQNTILNIVKKKLTESSNFIQSLGDKSINIDPTWGGVIDRDPVHGTWSVMFKHDHISDIEGLESKKEAIKAFNAAITKQKLHESDIKPFKPSKYGYGDNNERKVVYAIYDKSGNPVDYFLEADSKVGFERFKSLDKATLYVAYLKTTSNNPKKIWIDNQEYIDSHHTNSMHWSVEHNAWMY